MKKTSKKNSTGTIAYQAQQKRVIHTNTVFERKASEDSALPRFVAVLKNATGVTLAASSWSMRDGAAFAIETSDYVCAIQIGVLRGLDGLNANRVLLSEQSVAPTLYHVGDKVTIGGYVVAWDSKSGRRQDGVPYADILTSPLPTTALRCPMREALLLVLGSETKSLEKVRSYFGSEDVSKVEGQLKELAEEGEIGRWRAGIGGEWLYKRNLRA